MNHKVVVALDAMGGDYAPAETVKGAVEAVREHPEIKVILVGKEKEIKNELEKYTYSCLLYTSPSPRDPKTSRMPSSA